MPKVFAQMPTADDVLAEFEKKHSLQIGRPKPVVGLTTGNLAIDWQSGVGGIPAGRITELYGLEASGKTTTALQCAAQLQQQIIEQGSDDRILYLDYEHALDGDYATALGIDFDHKSFVPIQPTYFEQGANAALALIDTGQVRMVIFDSVAAMAPKRLKEGEFDQATIQMHRAKLMSALCQTMIGGLHDHGTAAIFINHKMESIEMTGRPGLPPKVTTPGGRGLKFYASLRLEFDTAGVVRNKMDNFLTGEEDNMLVGHKTMVKCVKNKVGTPGRTVEIRNRYGRGFDNAWSAIQILLSRKKIANSGSWFYFDKIEALTHEAMARSATGRPQIQGEASILDFADEHPEWRTELIAQAQRVLASEEENE